MHKSNSKSNIVYSPELKDPDDTFFFGRMRATRELKTVIIERVRGTSRIPIMEFEPSGMYNEILCHPLKANMAAMLVEKVIEKTQMTRNINKGEQEGVIATVGLLKYFEHSGGRLH